MNKKETYAILDNYYKVKNKISNKAIIQCNNTYDINKNVNSWLQENNLPYYLTLKKPIKNTNIKNAFTIENYWYHKIIFQKNKNIVYICLTKGDEKQPIVLSYIAYNENDTTYTMLLPSTFKKYIFIRNITSRLALLPEWYFTFIITNKKTENFYCSISNHVINDNVLTTLQTFSTCPQHFINYINEVPDYRTINDFRKIEQLLNEFTIETKVKTLNKNLQLFVNNFLKETLYDNTEIQKLLTRTDILEIIYKLCLNSAKQWKFEDIKYSGDLCKIITFCLENDNYTTILDTNRDTEYNQRLIEEYNDKRCIELISKKQHEIKELNNKPFLTDYILKVPLNVEDLIDEGKQQNNCVGSFYNKDIANGETKIIFIRKKDKPNKSYITCQLNKLGKIIQARLVNNSCNAKIKELQDKLSNITEDFYKKNRITEYLTSLQ